MPGQGQTGCLRIPVPNSIEENLDKEWALGGSDFWRRKKLTTIVIGCQIFTLICCFLILAQGFRKFYSYPKISKKMFKNDLLGTCLLEILLKLKMKKISHKKYTWLAHKQQCLKFRKSQKSAKSLHPTEQLLLVSGYDMGEEDRITQRDTYVDMRNLRISWHRNNQTTQKQYCGSGSVLNPYSGALWIRIWIHAYKENIKKRQKV